MNEATPYLHGLTTNVRFLVADDKVLPDIELVFIAERVFYGRTAEGEVTKGHEMVTSRFSASPDSMRRTAQALLQAADTAETELGRVSMEPGEDEETMKTPSDAGTAATSAPGPGNESSSGKAKP